MRCFIMTNLSKVEILFIRACKSLDSEKRIRSVYRRFYGNYDNTTTTNALIRILGDLVDKLGIEVSILTVYSDVISQFSYQQKRNFTLSDINKSTLVSLIGLIRYRLVDTLPKEQIWPKQFN